MGNQESGFHLEHSLGWLKSFGWLAGWSVICWFALKVELTSTLNCHESHTFLISLKVSMANLWERSSDKQDGGNTLKMEREGNHISGINSLIYGS